jgi:hypothetical protein
MPAELGVARAIDLPHAASAEPAGDFIAAEASAGYESHGARILIQMGEDNRRGGY